MGNNCSTPQLRCLASPRTSRRGITLIETSIVISVMLGLVSVMMVGAQAWKNGTDRSTCLLNIRNVQLAARSHQNMMARTEGQPFDPATIIGENKALPSFPICPAGGDYSFVEEFPPVGTLFMSCTITHHAPDDSRAW